MLSIPKVSLCFLFLILFTKLLFAQTTLTKNFIGHTSLNDSKNYFAADYLSNSSPFFIFDNLINKNSSYSIDDYNSFKDHQYLQLTCNSWLKTTNPGDAVKIGDLDISGNKLTVEASFNRIVPYTGGYLYGGDLVSKHADPTDCNYLLRPNNAEITTSNGFFQTPPVCEIELNKTYHVAMTYDGTSLKFYRNGFLLKEIPASGNLILNNWLTTIGDFAPGVLGTPENLNGFINEVRIWNVVRTQSEIRTYMNSSLPSPSIQTGLLAYYTFDNLLNKQGNATWNGTLGGNAAINVTNTLCTFTADSCALTSCAVKNDFSFKQNACNPYQLTFTTNATGYQNISWDFGDTNTASGSSAISHTYASAGNYTVTMIQKYANCSDTVRKTFSAAIQNDNRTVLTPDTTICLGSSTQLRAESALTYCWTPATALNDRSIQNPTTSATANITYYLHSEKKGTNLVVNGNFSLGNVGFSSDYSYVPASGFNPGIYTINNNITAWHPQMASCSDHTGQSGNGNMMLVNGAEIVNAKVWTQTVAVQPNTNYIFETWLQHITSVNPASLQFSINGTTIGPVFTANSTSCIWEKFSANWNSGNNTSATISIVNQNQIFTGNDFALDDISFSPIIISRDSVKIAVQDCSTTFCVQKNDFSFKQNACNPNQLTLSTTSVGYQSISWDFGDTNTANGSSTVSHTYATPGNYVVTMIQKYANCSDTVRKSFTIAIQNDNQAILTSDTTICIGSTKQLISAPALSYCWSPATHLNDATIQNPVTSSPANITYYLTSEKKGSNLIVNGNFSNGNTGFTSAYNYAAANVTEGQYFVGPSPQIWNSSLSNCGDHTSGNGNMMLVNGAPIADVKVWTQTIPVLPNTNYAFSTWIQALWPPNPAQLQFSINNNAIGSLITATLPTCNWSEFYVTWNSGNATSATISIVNKNTLVIGNDFALDDISFTPIIITRDSVKITVDSPKINTNSDSSVCIGSSIQLNSIGAATYSWTPATGLSASNISNPLATPVTTTKYIVTGTNSFGCVAKDSVTVTVNQNPVISISNDTLICRGGNVELKATGGATYNWSPSNTLSNPAGSNTFATPLSSTTYKVTVTSVDKCSSTDSVRVDVRLPNTFNIMPPAQICSGDSVRLIATGGDIYSWAPASALSNQNLANPFAFPTSTTDYNVTITDTLCNLSETLTTTVNVNPLPLLTTSKSNDVDCSTTSSQLNVTGAMQYAWMPAATLNNASIQNPIASPSVTTKYIVTGKDINGCINTDSITVVATANNSGNYLLPNAFTPNNDGINDCFGILNWGSVTNLEFSIYNRWGQRVFYSTDAGNCWNGNYKAEPQTPGVYTYVIIAKNACGSIKRNGIVTLVR